MLLFFTCWVCTGIMANFTVVMPLTIYYAGHELHAAAVISSYAVGALISLTFWSTYNPRALKSAYLTHAVVMTVGNAIFAAGAMNSSAWTTQYLARFIVGLEGGCMYNANLALVGYSSKANRVKYLSYYQSFVGVGLVLGPSVSALSVALVAATGASDAFRYIFTGTFMSVWGAVLLLSLLVFMPSDFGERPAEATGAPLDQPLVTDQEEDAQPPVFWTYMFLGNFWRIFQRLAWEVAAVVLLAHYFGWGGVAAGFSLSFYGFAQAVAQYGYGKGGSSNVVRDLKGLEVIELIGILGMFSKTDATHDALVFFNVTFVIFSIFFYVGSCLTSAPFNDIVLTRSAGLVDYEHMLLASQYGIFFAFLLAPIATRGLFQLNSASPSTIASLLVVGWAFQSIVNASLSRQLDSNATAALGVGVAAIVTWASFDHASGGTGITSVFTYHPVFMAWAFYGFMTPGQLVYREDAKYVRFFAGSDKIQIRKSHALWMALAFVFAVAAYWCIFAAHQQSGESQIGVGEREWSRTAHVAVGYPCLAWLVVQAVVGVLKGRSTTKIFRWHGTSGKYLQLAGYIVSTLGFWLRMNYSRQGGWTLPLKLALTGFALALFGYRALPINATPAPGSAAATAPGDLPSRGSPKKQNTLALNDDREEDIL